MLKTNVSRLLVLAVASAVLVSALALLPTQTVFAADLDPQDGYSGAFLGRRGPGRPLGAGQVSTPTDPAPSTNTQRQLNSDARRGRFGADAGNAGDNLAGATLGPLSEAEAQGLSLAIAEEFGAQALYQSVLDTFGDVAPFNAIVRSEAQHAAALVRLAEKYGVALPEYPAAGSLPAYNDLQAACQAGVEAEIVDGALYDQLKAVTTHTDLLRVYTNLQNASLNQHLPAFQVCQ